MQVAHWSVAALRCYTLSMLHSTKPGSENSKLLYCIPYDYFSVKGSCGSRSSNWHLTLPKRLFQPQGGFFRWFWGRCCCFKASELSSRLPPPFSRSQPLLNFHIHARTENKRYFMLIYAIYKQVNRIEQLPFFTFLTYKPPNFHANPMPPTVLLLIL